MRKLWIVFLVLSMLIILGCRTVEYVYPEYELPSEPQREMLEQPETVQDLALIINYYDSLVSEWEQWAVSTKEIITTEN